MRTKLSVLSSSPPESLTDAQLRKTVSHHQQRMKCYTDVKCGARVSAFRVGDSVRVKIPYHVAKAHPKFSKPKRILRKVAENTYMLEDGRKRNARHVAPCCVPAATSKENAVVAPAQAPPLAPKPSRVRKEPAWLQDYIKQ